MLCKLTGVIEQVTAEGRVIIALPALGIAHEALAPASALEHLRERAGETRTLHTLERYEQESQGASLVPTLLVFLAEEDRRFFRLLTRVRGLGARKALRAMSAPTGEIARAIAQRDTAWLVGLPEIGKRLAETIVMELADKVAPFAEHGASIIEQAPGAAAQRDAIETALAAMVRLGESRADAQRRLAAVAQRMPELATPDELLAAAYAGNEDSGVELARTKKQ